MGVKSNMSTSIVDFLQIGKKNAISATELCMTTKLPERAIQKEVLEARLRGELVISDESGYYLPADESEIREYAIRRKAYIATAQKALKPFLKVIQGR